MKKESKFLSLENFSTEKVNKAEQASLKGGFYAQADWGCPPPTTNQRT